MSVCAALLAAGEGSRFLGPQHKLLTPLRGRPLWEWGLDHVLEAGFDHTVVVTGAVDLTLPPAAAALGAVLVRNERWAQGQAGSLQVAVAHAAALGADAVIVGLGDQPGVPPDAWRAVAAAADCPIALATYGGVRGPHPVRLSSGVWPLLPTTGDDGARRLVRSHPQWVCEVPCLGSASDIDTLEDLARWTG